MKTLILSFLFLLFSTLIFAQVSVGEAAPNFSLSVLNSDDTISLSGQRQKVVYIFFYGAGCPHCRNNGPVTETQIYQPFKDDTNFVALGLDTWNNNATTNNSFRSVTGITYPLLLNAQNVLADYYGTTSAYDRSVVIGADGNVRYKGTGYVNTDYEDVVAVIETELAKVSTATETDPETASDIQLYQNYPNPFNPQTVISYQLPASDKVSLRIFNSLGQEIALLVDAVQSAGLKSISWNASSQPSGIYYYRLETSETALTRKMLLIK